MAVPDLGDVSLRACVRQREALWALLRWSFWERIIPLLLLVRTALFAK